MRFGWLLIVALLTSCTGANKRDIFVTSLTNLTESQIRSLPVDVTFEKIEKQLRHYTHSEIAIPLIAFEVEGQKERECMMLFDDSGKLQYVWWAPAHESSAKLATLLWPREMADRKLSEIEETILKKG